MATPEALLRDENLRSCRCAEEIEEVEEVEEVDIDKVAKLDRCTRVMENVCGCGGGGVSYRLDVFNIGCMMRLN